MEKIPVLLDSSPGSAEGGIVRCVYFHIEAEDVRQPWFLGSGDSSIPFLMIGMEGILISPDENVPRFRNSGDIDGLFERVEKMGLHVETGDIWLPAELFRSLDRLQRWNVLRVDPELFFAAWQIRNGDGEIDGRFLELDRPQSIEISREETRAFAGWARSWNKELVRLADMQEEQNRHLEKDKDDDMGMGR